MFSSFIAEFENISSINFDYKLLCIVINWNSNYKSNTCLFQWTNSLSPCFPSSLQMLKSCRQLSMTVRSPNLPVSAPPPQQSTGPWLLRQTYSWMDRQGRPVSPPPEYARASPPVLVAPPPPPPRWNYSRSNKEKTIRKVSFILKNYL